MTSPAPHASPLTPGAVVDGKYRVVKKLGQGGMGVVVEATHMKLREPVALKFLHGEVARNASHVERFLREARAAARIRSEHVARVLDVGTLATGESYMVMELLLGQDLNQLSRARGPLPVGEAVGYVLQACEAMAEAHRLGIVHRDLKPSNIFLTQRADGAPLVKVLDFGISKLMGAEDEALTATSDFLGSPLYMSPEQIRDARTVDGRSDIWALGSILYKLLAGRAPFAADTSASTLARIIADPVPPLRAARPDVGDELDGAISRCLEKSPDRRYARVEQLSEALVAAMRAPSASHESVAARGATVLAAAGSTSSSLPTHVEAALAGATQSDTVSAVATTPRMRARDARRAWIVAGGLAGSAMAAAALGLGIAGSRAAPARALAGGPPIDAMTASASSAAELLTPPTTETAAPSPPAPSTIATPSAAPPAPAKPHPSPLSKPDARPRVAPAPSASPPATKPVVPRYGQD